HPGQPHQARAEGPELPGDRHPQHAGRPPGRPAPGGPARRGAQPRAGSHLPGGGRDRRRHLRAAGRARGGGPGRRRPAPRARGHPAGSGRGGRARGGCAHRVARPPRRPGRPGSAPGTNRRTPVTVTGPAPHQRPPVTGSRVVALGHYQPSRVITNDDLARMVDTSDEWIRTRVGISERRIADEETVADMAAAAAEKALAGSGLTPADIDLVVVATCSSVDRVPNVSTRVARKLGIEAPASYDINTACSGFSYALATVDHAIRAGAARHALVIGAEKLTDFTDWTDRATCILFGDGAGA